MAKLPQADRAFIDPAKITDYLLCPTHPRGGPKCAFFESFGFSADVPDELAEALYLHATEHDIVKVRRGVNGMKYGISGRLRAPDGRMPIMRTVWIVRFIETFPRFGPQSRIESPRLRGRHDQGTRRRHFNAGFA